MSSYSRRQVALMLVVVAVAGAGLAVDRWRRVNPEIAAYLETLDRTAPPATEPVATRRVVQRTREPARARPPGDAHPTPVDLNLADVAELQRLVGPALAARIVDARERDGPFGSVDDLRRVRGLRRATLERLRPRVAVNTP
jgi:competence ComEA-like helix-hairpin-helix protein